MRVMVTHDYAHASPPPHLPWQGTDFLTVRNIMLGVQLVVNFIFNFFYSALVSCCVALRVAVYVFGGAANDAYRVVDPDSTIEQFEFSKLDKLNIFVPDIVTRKPEICWS